MKKVFISYSHKDEKWEKRLVLHLGVLKREKLLEVWDDRKIDAGEDWRGEIERALGSSDVAVLLVTANFLNSEFILSNEVPRLLERRQAEGARVIPLIVRPCAWRQVKWLRRMQVKPKDARALSSMKSHEVDKVLAELASEIIEVSDKAGEPGKRRDLLPNPAAPAAALAKPTDRGALTSEPTVEGKINRDFDSFDDYQQRKIVDAAAQIDDHLHRVRRLAGSAEPSSAKIVFFATAWGATHGPINSFNYDISRALSRLIRDRFDVVCVVPRAEQAETREAKKEGVRLVELRYAVKKGTLVEKDFRQVKELFPKSKKNPVLWWIGHDIHTGPITARAKEQTQMGRVAIFHHMGYKSYRALMPINAQESVSRQHEALNRGDVVFAVGPKLTKWARDIVRESPNIHVHELLPGLHKIRGLKPPEIFSAILFGRLSVHTDCVKSTKLVVAGFGYACSDAHYPSSLGRESSLMVIGLPSGSKGKIERDQLKRLAAERAGHPVQIHPWPYFEDRKRLFDELRRKSVCLVPSVYEGFGLVGLEAISAEVPLIISKNSGLYEFIDERIPGGRGFVESVRVREILDGPYAEEDVRKISWKLRKVKSDPKKAKRDVIALKALMQPICTWENCASTLAQSLGIVTKRSQEKKLCSKDQEDEICRLCNFSKVQLHEIFQNVKSFYGF